MQIKVEEKCLQDWQKMSLVNEQEKYCELCTKCVHDLDSYSFKELKNFLENNSSACIKIERKNLNQFNSFESSKSLSNQTKKWFQISSFIGFLSFTSITKAQERVENDSIILRGVINDVNNFPEADVFINLKGKKWGTYTDENGKFELKIPKSDSDYQLEFGNFEDDKQLFNVVNSSAEQLISLKHDSEYNYIVGEVVIKNYKRKRFFRNLGRTIAWPIKQIASIF